MADVEAGTKTMIRSSTNTENENTVEDGMSSADVIVEGPYYKYTVKPGEENGVYVEPNPFCLIKVLLKLLNFLKNLLFLIIFLVLYFPILLIIVIFCLCKALPAVFCYCCCDCALQTKYSIMRYGSFGFWLQRQIISTCQPFWVCVAKTPVISSSVNVALLASILKGFYSKVPVLPERDLLHDYTTFDGLYDEGRTTYSRILPRVNQKYNDKLPTAEKVTELFVRPADGSYRKESNCQSSLIVGYWAQWLVHQFFQTNPANEGHYVNQPVMMNLSQVYGSIPRVTNHLRAKKQGLLRSTWINGQEFPPVVTITEDNALFEFANNVYKKFGFVGKKKFEVPIELANMVPGFMVLNIIWFRQHQYVARSLHKAYPKWDDERLFHTAKMINLMICARIVANDYVRLLSSAYIVPQLTMDIEHLWDSTIYKMFGPSATQYMPAYHMTCEFNLLYRWHQLIPPKIRVMKKLDLNMKNLDKLEKENEAAIDVLPEMSSAYDAIIDEEKSGDNKIDSMERILRSATLEEAGQNTLLNTNGWLAHHVVKAGVDQGREWGLHSYNDYRERMGFYRFKTWEEFCDYEDVIEAMKKVYKNVDEVEYYVGLFGEAKEGGFSSPWSIFSGVGWALGGVFSMRILRTNWRKTFSPLGYELIGSVRTFDDLVALHTELPKGAISMTHQKEF